MPLKSMKINKKEVEKRQKDMMISDEPEYPYGLTIRLEEDSIAKLGITDLPEAGDKKTVLALVEVTDVGQRDSISGKKRRNLTLQITEMSLEDVKKESSTVSKLYGKE